MINEFIATIQWYLAFFVFGAIWGGAAVSVLKDMMYVRRTRRMSRQIDEVRRTLG